MLGFIILLLIIVIVPYSELYDQTETELIVIDGMSGNPLALLYWRYVISFKHKCKAFLT
jgi:hypothetical protein